MNFKDIWTSIVRTLTPVVVGALITFFSTHGYTFNDEAMQGMRVFIEALFTTGYYLIARILEIVHPNFGWLLGWAKQPTYNGPQPISGAQVIGGTIIDEGSK